jgi:hypothetical protein
VVARKAERSLRLSLSKGLRALLPLWYVPVALWLVQAAVTLVWQIVRNQSLAVSPADFRAARLRLFDGLLQLDPSLIGPGRILAGAIPEPLSLVFRDVGPPAAILVLILAAFFGALLVTQSPRLSLAGGRRHFFRMARLSALVAGFWALLHLCLHFGFAPLSGVFEPNSGGQGLWPMIQTAVMLLALAAIKCAADLARIRIVQEDRKSAFLAVTSSIGALLHDRAGYLPLFFVLFALDAGCILLIHYAAGAFWNPFLMEFLWILKWSVFALHYLAIRELFQLLKARRWSEELSHPSAKLRSQRNW